ncbi:MAG: SDR family oxidoreductase [Lachnospiraceae bacterium]|nr:SDR family oxidoreductase [Lachnospiraceae bacterium]
MEFQGKTVLITGGTSGMGLLSAICFAKEGANVVLTGTNEERMNQAIEEIKQITPNVIGCLADARDYAQVKACCDRAVAQFGSLDILIPCAGGSECRILNTPGEFKDLPIEVVDFGIDLNLKGALYFAHVALNQMAKQNSGVIIFIGSVTGEVGSTSDVAYSASKSALMNGVVKSIAQCGAKYGVRACCISPGPVLTRPGMARMDTLVGRAAEPQELVDMIMYMASEKGSFVNGVNILVDGGRSVMPNKSWSKK